MDPQNLPLPHFDASLNGINCYLKGIFYQDHETFQHIQGEMLQKKQKFLGIN